MAIRSVGFALRSEGKAELKNDFAEVKAAGQSSMNAVAEAAESASERSARAAEEFSARQIAAFKKQADAAKVSFATRDANAGFDRALSSGSGGVNLDRSSGSARQSASAFTAMFEAEEQAARQAAEAQRLAEQAEREREASVSKLRAAIDPLYVAQRRYDEELRTANSLLAQGAIGEEEHARAIALSTAELERARVAGIRDLQVSGLRRAGAQQLSFQLSDVSVQAQMGTPALTIFAQQSGQVVQALGMIAEGSTATGGRLLGFLRFLGGPWGLALTSAATLAIPLVTHLLDAGDAAEKSEAKMRKLGIAQDGLGSTTMTAAAAVNVLNKAQLQDRSESVAAGARSLAGERIKQAQATFAAATAEAALKKAQATARLADAADGRVNDGTRGGRELSTFQTRAGSELSRYRSVAEKDIADADADLANLEKSFTTARDRITRQVLSQDTQLIDSRAKLAAAETTLDRVRARAGVTEREATVLRDAGRISAVEYERRVTAARSSVEKAEAADRAASVAKRELTKETREATSAHQKLLDVITQLRTKTDEVGAEDLLSKRMGAINSLVGSKEINLDQATAYARSAFSEYYDQLDQEATERTSRLSLLLSPDLVKAAGPLDDATLKASIERNLAGIPQLEDKLKAIRPLIEDLRSEGAKLVDDVLDPSKWDSWGDAAGSVINQVRNELIKLALINPLKNLISGSSGGGGLSTLSSIGKLLGGVSGLAGSVGVSTSITHGNDLVNIGNIDVSGLIGHNASGTADWRGGLTYINENGGELVNLPSGAQIVPASETRRMMSAANDTAAGGLQVQVVKGDLFDVIVTRTADARVAAAAPGIALGGAQMAEARAGKRARYRIPGR